MRPRYMVTAIAALLLALAGGVAWPSWAKAAFEAWARARLGLPLAVMGGAGISLSPELALRLESITLKGAEGAEDTVLTARAVRIPVSLADIVTHRANFDRLILEAPEAAFLVDDRGQANWSFSGADASPLRLEIENGRLRYFDQRSGQSLALGGIEAAVDLDAAAAATITGTAELAGRLARLEAYVKSLGRIHGDGSPVDVSIDTPEGALTFNGRLATADILSLAGQVTLVTPDLRGAAHWAGLAIAPAQNFRKLAISGALDSAGRVFAIRKAKIELDGTSASGDVSLDLRGARPRLQALLAADVMALDDYLPKGSAAAAWGTSPLGFDALAAFDAELQLETAALSYGGAAVGRARAAMTLAGGKLDARIDTPAATGAMAFVAAIDANLHPPSLALSFTGDGIEAGRLLPGLAGIQWLRGQGSLSLALSGSGQTQQEIIGTLKGKGSFVLSDGAIAGTDLEAGLAAAQAAPREGWSLQDGGSTRFRRFSGSFAGSDGIFATKDLALDLGQASYAVSGEVDLLRRELDFTATAAGAAGTVRIKGPWQRPSFAAARAGN